MIPMVTKPTNAKIDLGPAPLAATELQQSKGRLLGNKPQAEAEGPGAAAGEEGELPRP